VHAHRVARPGDAGSDGGELVSFAEAFCSEANVRQEITNCVALRGLATPQMPPDSRVESIVIER
jgi:hypothetical protein